MNQASILGFGAALVDLLVEESEAYLQNLGCKKGGMTLVEAETINRYLKASTKQAAVVPGGSACNTVVGVAKLGGQAHFFGCCGDDDLGAQFQEGLKTAGVRNKMLTAPGETGRVLSVVTPDAQRTMFTHLGVAANAKREDVNDDLFKECTLVHLEGYLLFNPDLLQDILDRVKDLPIKVSLDLSSFEVVEATKPLLEKLLPESIDIVLANEDEARAYTGSDDEEKSLDIFSNLCEVAVVKQGKRGALIAGPGGKLKISAETVPAVDTTGAGDLWASGFLYGIAHGHSLEKSGLLGAQVAAQVVQTLGAVIPEEGWQRIHSWKDEHLSSGTDQ